MIEYEVQHFEKLVQINIINISKNWQVKVHWAPDQIIFQDHLLTGGKPNFSTMREQGRLPPQQGIKVNITSDGTRQHQGL
jgi:hypothetical protein